MSNLSHNADLLRAAYSKSKLEGLSERFDDVRRLAGLSYDDGRVAMAELERAGVLRLVGDLG